MDHEALAHAAAVVGALGACGLLLARERLLFLGGLAALVAAEAGLAYALVPDAPSLLTASATRFGAVAVVALFGLALAAVFARFPAAAPVALLVVAPFRLSVGPREPGGVPARSRSTSCSRRLLRPSATASSEAASPRRPLLVAGPTAALVALSGISLLWAKDLRAGTIELVFFYFPFSVLLSVVALTRPRDWSWRALATGLVAVTSVFAAIGVYQAWSHTEILAKQDVQLANAYSSLFRVTSVFQDPNVYGRHLVLGIVVVLTALWLALLRPAVGLPVLGLLTVGLYFSYSQTSFVALFCAVLVVSLLAGDRLTRRVVVGVSAALVLAAGIVVLAEGNGDSTEQVTSDRTPLVQVTWPVYAAHPVVGVGIGSQPLVSRREEDAKKRKSKNVSHTTPLTVAAELGTIGLLVYLVFLAALGRAILEAWRRHRALGSRSPAASPRSSSSRSSTAGSSRIRSSWGIAGVAAAALTFLPKRASV